VVSTSVRRSWSRKSCPTCEAWVVALLPRRVPLVRMVVVLTLWARMWMCAAPVEVEYQWCWGEKGRQGGMLTAGVVAGNDGLVLSDTVGVGLDDATEESVVEVVQVVGVTVARGRDARIDTSGVAVPEVHVDGGDGLASAGVDELDVKVHGDTLLAIGDVAADKLAVDVVRALGDFRLQDAGRVVREEKGLIITVLDTRGRLVGRVVVRKVTADKRAGKTSLDPGLLSDLVTTRESSLGETPTSELRSTRADRVGTPLDESCALSCLLGQIMARVGESRR
jgi:hypothetical protein